MSLLDLLFPRKCVSCNKIGSYFCKKCIAKIEYIAKPICPICAKLAIDGATHPGCKTPWVLDGMFALAYYKGPVRDAIHLLKYKFVSDAAESLVSLLVDFSPKRLPKFNFFIPVPLHKKRKKFRGFNQSLFLAKILGEKIGVEVKKDVLKKIRDTKPQVNLKEEDRKSNLQGVFILNRKSNIRDKIIGLIDDVATTRATLLECTKVLKRNGAKEVWGIVLAHG